MESTLPPVIEYPIIFPVFPTSIVGPVGFGNGTPEPLNSKVVSAVLDSVPYKTLIVYVPSALQRGPPAVISTLNFLSGPTPNCSKATRF